ncbi:MAG TPA: hypothetical protein VIH50_05725 [Steroidobacteraceae bacterium]
MRERTDRRPFKSLAAAAALSACLHGAAWADSGGENGQPAGWAQKEFRFIYQGITTKYSCDGLRDKMRQILLEFGARKQDLKVYDYGCSSPSGRPDIFPAVSVKMSVLVPADNAADAVPSHWQPVRLKLGNSSLDEAGQCELIEQVKHNVLPLFTARNVDLQDFCVPHQLLPGGTRLVAKVLMADQAPTSAK